MAALTLELCPQDLEELRRILALYVPGAEVWAYGSRVNGEAHEGSDLDLVIRNTADMEQCHPKLSRLHGALRESNLPMLIDLHDWARTPESFRKSIESAHLVVQARQLEKESS